MKNIIQLIKTDNYIFGGIIALILPLIFFMIITGINKLIVTIFSQVNSMTDANILLISIALNMLAMRYYLVNLKYDKTGRGILFVTFFEGFAYFFLVMRLNWQGF